MNLRIAKVGAVLIAILSVPLAIGLAQRAAGKSADSGSAANEKAIKEVVARFSDGWNSHDAHAMCASLADDVQWVSWRGDVVHSRQEVESEHATLFGGLYKNTHRTDMVKSIRYLTPNIVSVDNYWTMTGAKTRDGADWPYRAGYVNYVMEKRGTWVITMAHTADFNAKAPAPSGR